MVKEKITVLLDGGLQARKVAMFVQLASRYESSVFVEYCEKKINAKSIMGMMSLGIAKGEELTILTDGDDEVIAMQDIVKYLADEEG